MPGREPPNGWTRRCPSRSRHGSRSTSQAVRPASRPHRPTRAIAWRSGRSASRCPNHRATCGPEPRPGSSRRRPAVAVRHGRPPRRPALAQFGAIAGVAVVAVLVGSSVLSGAWLDGPIGTTNGPDRSIAAVADPDAEPASRWCRGRRRSRWMPARSAGSTSVRTARMPTTSPTSTRSAPRWTRRAAPPWRTGTGNASRSRPRRSRSSPHRRAPRPSSSATTTRPVATRSSSWPCPDTTRRVATPTPTPTPTVTPTPTRRPPRRPPRRARRRPVGDASADRLRRPPPRLRPRRRPSSRASSRRRLRPSNPRHALADSGRPGHRQRRHRRRRCRRLLAGRPWFAFTARPADGSAGPDIYLWRVGDARAKPVTTDHASAFGVVGGGQVIGSRPAAAGSARREWRELRPGQPVAPSVLDRSEHRAPRPPGRRAGAPRSTRPVRGPSSWDGSVDPRPMGPRSRLTDGRLVLDAWADGATRDRPGRRFARGRLPRRLHGPLGRDRHLARRVGRRRRAIRPVGRLSLLHIDPTTGNVERPKAGPQDVPALPGFSIENGRLAWATPPSQDGEGSRVQIVAWSDDGVGSIESAPGQDVVVVR